MKNSHPPASAAALNGANSPSTEQAKAHIAERKPGATKAKVKVAAPSGKGARRASRQGSGAETGQLVCRYCSSDDLAPSFIKRRDTRCRACFKARYGAKRKGADHEPV